MNERIKELSNKAVLSASATYAPGPDAIWLKEYNKKFAELIIKECNKAVLEVPCYYKDYRSQIEESVINDCARAVLEHFGVEE